MTPAEARAQAEALAARLAAVERIAAGSTRRSVRNAERLLATETDPLERRALRIAIADFRHAHADILGLSRTVTAPDLPHVAARPRVTARAVLQPVNSEGP